MTRHRRPHLCAPRLTRTPLQATGLSLGVLLALAAPAAALDIPVGEQYKLTFYGFLNPAVVAWIGWGVGLSGDLPKTGTRHTLYLRTDIDE